MRPSPKSEAEAIVSYTAQYAMPSRIMEILEQRNDLMDTFRWAVQTVHQAHHEGDMKSCPKNTCSGYQRCIERIGVNWPPVEARKSYAP